MSALPTQRSALERATPDVLERAADLIEPEGAWIQGGFGLNEEGVVTQSLHELADDSTCFCAMGAVSHVAGGPHKFDWAMIEPLVVVAGLEAATSVTTWNDAPERTQSEVVAALRGAAKAARESGK